MITIMLLAMFAHCEAANGLVRLAAAAARRNGRLRGDEGLESAGRRPWRQAEESRCGRRPSDGFRTRLRRVPGRRRPLEPGRPPGLPRAGSKRLLVRSPDYVPARLKMADVLLENKQSQAALCQIQEALKAHPEDPEAQHRMAGFLEATGKGGQALPYYEQAAKSAPGNEIYTISCRRRRRPPSKQSSPRQQPVHKEPRSAQGRRRRFCRRCGKQRWQRDMRQSRQRARGSGSSE